MSGMRKAATTLIVREHDFVPRADLRGRALRRRGRRRSGRTTAPHCRTSSRARPRGARRGHRGGRRSEADYVLVPLTRPATSRAPQGARSGDRRRLFGRQRVASTGARARGDARAHGHLGDDDRAVGLGGARGAPARARRREERSRRSTPTLRQRYSAALATFDRGGATDLGCHAHERRQRSRPEAARRHRLRRRRTTPPWASWGSTELEQRLAKLPRPPRIFALGVGRDVDMAILEASPRRLRRAHRRRDTARALSALKVLELAERPAWVGTEVDLGSTVERVYPRNVSAMVADETVLVVGRVNGRGAARRVIVQGSRRQSRELPAHDAAARRSGRSAPALGGGAARRAAPHERGPRGDGRPRHALRHHHAGHLVLRADTHRARGRAPRAA